MFSQGQPTISWSYNNQAEWSKYFPCANGLCQSPINIKTNATVPEFFSPLSFSSKYNSDLLFTMTNNGQQILTALAEHTDEHKNDELWISGINLNGKYYFVNFHIHWGQDKKRGGEHEIDGHRFQAEVHFVHRNNETNEFAVLGFFLTTSNHNGESNEWDKYATIASQLTKANDKTNCVFNLSRLMQMKHQEFYRYNGSLTSPPCTEGIIWTLFPYEVPIKEESLNLLRRKIMPNSYRPVQPLNGRTVFRNYEHSRII